MKRKNFLKISALSTIAISNLNAYGLFNSRTIQKNNEIIKPPRLKAGDTVGLVSPAGFLSEKSLNESIENMEKLGFKVKVGKNVLERNGYLAGTDQQRADDINEMFRDESVNAIVCTRGGYGVARMLHLLDYDAIKNNPKILIGYSDITALLYGIFSQTGLIAFHGPVATSTFDEFSTKYFEKVLMNNSEKTLLPMYEEHQEDSYIIRSGHAKGKLVGGNLSIVVSLIGTPYDVDLTDKILYLEEVREEPYRIDRFLTQLISSGKLKDAAGIAMGVFRNCEIDPDRPSFERSFTLKEVLFDRLFDLGIPVVYGLSFGHIANKYTLPFGIEAELNTTEKSITLLENTVE
ncbi:MAG: LD-carboxypeptidase [Melioribacteraceae bacterium]|nr:LD-carboxypeptidase [Melioribacteraceae bacterium]